MALQPPPNAWLSLIGAGLYRWLVKFVNDVSTVQTATNGALFISGLTIQNNTPSGGKISWSASTLYYQGVAYAIAAGSTPNSELFVTWTVGASTFTVGNSYTPGPTVFPILTNTQGTADVTWDKAGANSVQATHLFPVLTYDGPNGSLIISGVTFTDHQPISTIIQWSACQATYQGITYSIPSGNADNVHIYIIWKLSSPTQFQALTGVLTLGVDDFLIGVNIPSGSPSANAFFARATRFTDRSGAAQLILEDSLIAYNKNGNPVTAIGRQSTDGAVGASGAVSVILHGLSDLRGK